MKELTSAFNSEVFRPVVSLIVPGFFGLSTSFIVILQRVDGALQFADAHAGASAVVLLLSILTVGLIAEDLGARIELHFDKQIADEEKKAHVDPNKSHKAEWFDYLSLAFQLEPVGHRYLRSLVLRMKFELGMSVMSVPFAVGAIMLNLRWWGYLVIISIAAASIAYFLNEARGSHKLLSKLRREMLRRFRERPINGSQAV